jgi:hypothetical protein
MKFWLVLLTFLAAHAGAATRQCGAVFRNQSFEDLWRGQGKDLFMSIRENAPHYWAWAKEISAELPPALLAKGIVAGDPHLLNFGDLYIKKEGQFALVDLDDGGRAPFLFDIVRYLVANRAAFVKVAQNELVDAYLLGLRLEKNKMPKRLRQALEEGSDNFSKNRDDYIDSVTKGERFKKEKLHLEDVQKASPERQRQINETIKVAKDLFAQEILDVGFKVKETGGSQGMLRIWILSKTKKGNLRIWELKECSEPAVAQFDSQLPQIQRLEQLKRLFWQAAEEANQYGVFKVGERYYLKRPRLHGQLLRDLPSIDEKEDVELAKKELIYAAYYLGSVHGSQKESLPYLQAIGSEFSLSSVLEILVNRYIQIARSHGAGL